MWDQIAALKGFPGSGELSRPAAGGWEAGPWGEGARTREALAGSSAGLRGVGGLRGLLCVFSLCPPVSPKGQCHLPTQQQRAKG